VQVNYLFIMKIILKVQW